MIYSKTCVKQPLSKRLKIGFQLYQLSLDAGQKYCRMLQREHSAILLTFIRLPFVIKIFVLSTFECPFYTDVTISYFMSTSASLVINTIREYSYLAYKSSYPNSNEYWVSLQSFKYISLTMNFAGIYFITQSHHNKRVKNNSEMLSRR